MGSGGVKGACGGRLPRRPPGTEQARSVGRVVVEQGSLGVEERASARVRVAHAQVLHRVPQRLRVDAVATDAAAARRVGHAHCKCRRLARSLTYLIHNDNLNDAHKGKRYTSRQEGMRSVGNLM